LEDMMEIGLGSMVVQQPGGGLVMCVTAVDGDHLFCVSTDNQKSVRQWFARSRLMRAACRSARRPYPEGLQATG
jgi:hypothetical protein